MNRGSVVCAVAVAFVWLPGCSRVADRGSAIEKQVPEETSAVGFDLEPVPSSDGSQQWIATYSSTGKVAKFGIDLGPAETVPGKAAGDPGVISGEGTLLPKPGSDSSVLLADLKKALRAKSAATAPTAKTSVPFTYVKLGDNLSRAPGGEFSASPAGNWTALKLIFGDGDKESEVLLHLNASIKKGQFSMKDPRRGDLVLAEFAKVL